MTDITVKLPDGTTARFPEGTTPDVMKAAIQKRFPPQAVASLSLPPEIAERARMAKAGTLVADPANVAKAEALNAEALPSMQPTSRPMAALNAGAQGLSMGWADDGMRRIAGMAGESPFGPDDPVLKMFGDAEQQGAASSEAYPGTSIPIEIASSLAVPGNIFSAGEGLGSRFLSGLGNGALTGAVYGAGKADDDSKLSGAGWGAGFGGAVGGALPLIGAGIRNFPGIKGMIDDMLLKGAAREAGQGAPMADDIAASARKLYGEADAAAPPIPQGSFPAASLVGKMGALDDLPGQSMTPQGARLAATVEDIATAPNQSDIPWEMIQKLSSNAKELGREVNPLGMATRDATAGTQLAKGLREYIETLPGDVGEKYGQANEIWRRMLKTKTIENMMEKAKGYRSGEESGFGNQVASALRRLPVAKTFNPAERKLMEYVISGGNTQKVANALGSGLGRIATATAGAGVGATGGPFGSMAGLAIGGATSLGARKIAEALAGGNAKLLRDAVASGKLTSIPSNISEGTRKILFALGLKPALVINSEGQQ